jgi:hypothetical protein
VTFILILIALGVAGYFAFPSIPKVNISEPYIPQGRTLQINGGNVGIGIVDDVLAGRPFSLLFPSATDVTVESPSYINVGITKIEVEIRVKDRADQVINNFIGIGEVRDQRFPARSTTQFTMVFPSYLAY